MNRTNEYRAKAFECLSLAEIVNDPERLRLQLIPTGSPLLTTGPF
jgi:hypothetical protein